MTYPLPITKDEDINYLMDIIQSFVTYHISLSTKILMCINERFIMVTHPPILLNLETPFLLYETTIGDVIRNTCRILGRSDVGDKFTGQNYPKTLHPILVWSQDPFLTTARKVSREADANLLRDNLEAFLSAPTPQEKDLEHKRLIECIIEVNDRSEPVDFCKTLIGLGYMQGRDYGFCPPEPFEEILVETR